MPNLTQLPTLREFHELSDAATEEVRTLDRLPTLKELAESAKQLRLSEEPEVKALEEAVNSLNVTENVTRDALLSQGIELVDEDDDDAGPRPAIPHESQPDAVN